MSINTAIAIAVDGDKIEITPPPVAGQPVALAVAGATIPPIGTFPIAGGAHRDAHPDPDHHHRQGLNRVLDPDEPERA